jgi:ElaB/YqjD/DUF883 family membrane-anchored ribosome-binding protein
MEEVEAVYTPTQVSDRIGLKAGMTRRYSIAYEAVTGEDLPRDSKGGRLYTEQVVAILEAARRLVRQTPSLSAEDAIRSVLGLATAPTLPAMPQEEGITREQAERLIEAIKALHEDSRVVRNEIKELKEQVNKALPSNGSPGSDEIEGLRKRIKYLQGELERREMKAHEVRRRPWWQCRGRR